VILDRGMRTKPMSSGATGLWCSTYTTMSPLAARSSRERERSVRRHCRSCLEVRCEVRPQWSHRRQARYARRALAAAPAALAAAAAAAVDRAVRGRCIWRGPVSTTGPPNPQLRASTSHSASLDAERHRPSGLAPGPACPARATERCVRPSHGGARWEADCYCSLVASPRRQ